MLAPEPLACSTNFSFRLMTRSSLQGIRPEDHRQRCPATFVSAMSWYCTREPTWACLAKKRRAVSQHRGSLFSDVPRNAVPDRLADVRTCGISPLLGGQA